MPLITPIFAVFTTIFAIVTLSFVAPSDCRPIRFAFSAPCYASDAIMLLYHIHALRWDLY